jgi:hypothetical protein
MQRDENWIFRSRLQRRRWVPADWANTGLACTSGTTRTRRSLA